MADLQPGDIHYPYVEPHDSVSESIDEVEPVTAPGPVPPDDGAPPE